MPSGLRSLRGATDNLRTSIRVAHSELQRAVQGPAEDDEDLQIYRSLRSEDLDRIAKENGFVNTVDYILAMERRLARSGSR